MSNFSILLDADQITDQIWVGGFPKIKQQLTKFTHVLNISGVNYDPPSGVIVKHINYVPDTPDTEISRVFDMCVDFISDAI